MRISFRSLHKRKAIPFFAGLTVAAVALLGVTGLAVQKVSAADYSGNAIMYGGFSSPSEFIQQIRNNDNGRHSDLTAVYANYGLASADYSKFVSYSLSGTDYRDGHITVQNNGQEMTVATGVKSIGRQLGPQGAGAFSQNINGTTYYGNSNNQAFAAGIGSLPVQVFFSAQGVMQFAVIKDCGNPTHGTSFVPNATCNELNMVKSTTQQNTYTFSANVSQNANLFTKYVYNFGDGSAPVTTTNPNTPVTHTYTKAGNWRASVTPYIKLPGNPERPIAVGNCVHVIPVVLPAYDCLVTTAALADSQNKFRYNFRTSTSAKNGAQLSKIVYTTNGATITSTAADGSASYAYTKKGSYAVIATAYFTVPGRSGLQSATSAGCHAAAQVSPPLYECLSLSGSLLVDSKNEYQFIAKAKYDSGVTPLSADFTYGDGKVDRGVRPTSVTATTANFIIQHEYPTANAYNVSAQLYFAVPGMTGTTAANYICTASTKPHQPPVSTCKPGIPVGDTRCNPCPTNPAVPADDTADCTTPPPPALPNTGAGNTIAIFAAVVIGGFLVYRTVLYRRHKEAFMAAQQGTSALPLADPLSETPLVGTPLAPKLRKTFRRNRPF